ncbi:uncharacterized protein TM35_000621170 [Trypanosoma theileri]|uniref:Mucin TcMUCII n=1 Tax=Trypanosoma theileri TaxID=67003 RepID=A0A1X0NGR2_9TRYP|nr:uncharacterized protein TM35_000621170 [Trypanosoma theileri]ORC83643.1 hypothetical protein TM35_000621170 [Trypanosoma theileri]
MLCRTFFSITFLLSIACVVTATGPQAAPGAPGSNGNLAVSSSTSSTCRTAGGTTTGENCAPGTTGLSPGTRSEPGATQTAVGNDGRVEQQETPTNTLTENTESQGSEDQKNGMKDVSPGDGGSGRKPTQPEVDGQGQSQQITQQNVSGTTTSPGSTTKDNTPTHKGDEGKQNSDKTAETESTTQADAQHQEHTEPQSSGTDASGTPATPSQDVANPEGESSINEESNTTTTTTTTLPPKIANNKKGDADSSSISSSVWVRVPLLIVVTLACILVC